jgi:hypothetical protein
VFPRWSRTLKTAALRPEADRSFSDDLCDRLWPVRARGDLKFELNGKAVADDRHSVSIVRAVLSQFDRFGARPQSL